MDSSVKDQSDITENKISDSDNDTDMDSQTKGLKRYKKLYIRVLIIAICAIGLFYFSCGEELYSRISDASISDFGATNDTGEIVEGCVIEQTFTSETDIIESIGVMASNYGRTLGSELKVQLVDAEDHVLIYEQTYASSDIGVNEYVQLEFPKPLEQMRGRILKIEVTSNAVSGDAPTVLYNVENKLKLVEHVADHSAFTLNGEETSGVLCITLEGRDNVWTGPNFWKIALAALVFISLLYWLAVWRYSRGKKDFIFSVYAELTRYKFLIQQLVSRDFKVRYKRSALGVLWSLLNPTLMMLVQYIVFSQLFKFDIDNFPLYLLSGTIVFNFFNEGVSQALTSIVGNASLITKVYMPKYVYPVTRVMSSGINLLMSLIPLVLVAAITHEEFTRAYIMLPYILICLMIFTTGFGMMMSAMMVFFRDMQFLWGVVSMMWMYLTPLFYPITIIPDTVQKYMYLNPIIYYVNAVRNIVMDGYTPQPIVFFQCTMIALVMLGIGGLIFRKTQDRFIMYI